MILDTELIAKVSAFLNIEADMLDQKDYQQWLTLWHQAGLYIVPVDHNETDHANSLNVAYDDDEMRKLRIERLTSGEAVSTQRAEKTVRTLSRVRIVNVDGDKLHVRCAYALYENNKNGLRCYPANIEFDLQRDGDSFKILQKVVRVMKSEQHLTTVSYLF